MNQDVMQAVGGVLCNKNVTDEVLDERWRLHTQQVVVYFSEHISFGWFWQAWCLLQKQYPALRYAFLPTPEAAYQVYECSAVKTPVAVMDFSEVDAGRREDCFTDMLDSEKKLALFLSEPPLMRIKLVKFAQADHRMVWTYSSLLFDSLNVERVIARLFAIYRQVAKQCFPYARPEACYLTYLQVSSVGQDALRARWAAQLQEYAVPTELQIKSQRSGVMAVMATVRRVFGSTTLHQVRALAKANNVSVDAIFYAVWGIVLSLYARRDNVIFGVVYHFEHTDGVVGNFERFFPTCLSVDRAKTFLTLVAEAQVFVDLMAESVAVTAAELLSYTSVPPSTMFSTFFSLALTPIEKPMPYEMRHTSQPIFDFFVKLCVEDEAAGTLSLNATVDTSNLNERIIENMLRNYEHVLSHCLQDMSRPLNAVSLVSSEEYALVHSVNHTRHYYPGDETVLGQFDHQVRKNPHAVALYFDEEIMTYQMLYQQSNQLANYLLSLEVVKGEVVAVCLDRSFDLLVALMAIMRVGAVYLPIDPVLPIKRIHYMLTNAGAVRVISQTPYTNRFVQLPNVATLIDMGERAAYWYPTDMPVVPLSGDDLIYVIYTSGSTGNPKGVMNHHKGVVNRLLWMWDALGFRIEDVFLQKTPVCFDVSVWELFLPLMKGASLVILQPEAHKDMDVLINTINTHHVSIIHFIPSAFYPFLAHSRVATCESLRIVCASGEALTRNIQDRLFSIFPQCRLVNLYGPTEASVDVTWWECKPHSPLLQIPIGRPIANTQIHVLDSALRPVPVGVTGELYIGGIGVASGYINNPELTAERFIPDPFSTEASARLYRTGDAARWSSDGYVIYLGRLDEQVKVKGFRIELTEIQIALLRNDDVNQAAVVARDFGQGYRLVAYIVLKPGSYSTGPDIRNFLAQFLPEYMVPSYVHFTDVLPTNVNGKLAIDQLPEPILSVLQMNYKKPESPVEKAIARTWANGLRIERVGIVDNFFELGGDSIAAIQIVSLLRKEGVRVLPRWFFEYQTIEELARVAITGDPAEMDKPKEVLPSWRDTIDEESLAIIMNTAGRMVAHE